MKKILLFMVIVGGFLSTVQAQKKRPTTKRATTTKKATVKKPVKKTDSAINTAAAPAPALDSIPIKPGIVSMENDNVYTRLLVKERTPLVYEDIREDDVVYKQRVWRMIDVREKMNQPFTYDADEDNGNQKFISILLNGIQTGKITAVYDPIDDAFKKSIDKAGIIDRMVGKPVLVQVTDWAKDPTGNTKKDSLITNEFSPESVKKFEVKEDWVFDKESSRMHVRILGIAPVVDVINDVTGEVIGDKKLFWVYYPKIRQYLTGTEAYNGRNFGARPSWEEVFEGRMFSSYIVKSTIDNFRDLYLDKTPGLKENGILRLWEGENIKKKIFDYEQNLWSY
jgi:gliding motility associated protien GldN